MIKKQLIKMMQSLLFKQREKQVVEKQQKKIDKKYVETDRTRERRR